MEVIITQNVPAFMGADMKEYGPFEIGQTVVVSQKIGELMVNRNLAKAKTEERKEVLVDFEGTKSIANRVLVPEDAYDATFVSASFEQVPSYDNPKVSQTKIIFQLSLDGKDIILPLFANPVIKKSSGTKGYSNSKLFDLLVKADLLDAAKRQHEALETFAGLAGFLDANFKGRRARVLVKVSNKGTENAYSTIGDVVRFLGVRE